MSCPVCFNAAGSDETIRASLNLGILVLMGVTAVVLAGFLRFVISIVLLSKADLKVRLYDDRAYDDRAEPTIEAMAAVEAGLQARLPT